jgi:DNA-binding CsgD family transcriptional regulator
MSEPFKQLESPVRQLRRPQTNMTNQNQSKPWLDPSGEVYSDGALREISKTWDANTWEYFLKDTVDRSEREINVSTEDYDFACANLTEKAWNDSTPRLEWDDPLKALVRRTIRDHLTVQQQQVVRLTYWGDLPERQIAEILGVYPNLVHIQKRRSLNKLRGLLEHKVCTFTKGVGAARNSDHVPVGIADVAAVFLAETNRRFGPYSFLDSQIRKVYIQDRKGAYLT